MIFAVQPRKIAKPQSYSLGSSACTSLQSLSILCNKQFQGNVFQSFKRSRKDLVKAMLQSKMDLQGDFLLQVVLTLALAFFCVDKIVRCINTDTNTHMHMFVCLFVYTIPLIVTAMIIIVMVLPLSFFVFIISSVPSL